MTLAQLEDLLETAGKKLQHQDRPLLFSFSHPLTWQCPSAFLRQLQRRWSSLPFQYWHVPDQGTALIGVGVSLRLEAESTGRFQQIKQRWHEFCSSLMVHSTVRSEDKQGNDCPGRPLAHLDPKPGPILMGGFSFFPFVDDSSLWQGFGGASFVLPRFQLVKQGSTSWITCNLLLGHDDDLQSICRELIEEWSELARIAELGSVEPEPKASGGNTGDSTSEYPPVDDDVAEVWLSSVRQALQEINRGTIEKIVLARQVDFSPAPTHVLPELLAHLEERFPHCMIFAVQRGPNCFVGATPELLASVRGSLVRTMCLAGSAPRGVDPQQDDALGQEMKSDEKELAEHRFVVQMLKQELGRLCSNVKYGDEPELLKLDNVQHLHTPIEGELKNGLSILDVIEKLHPTPAVGGVPKEAALEKIRQWEHFDRGWYAGPIGWLDAHGGGEFAVAIRSALMHGKGMALFTGCGIVAGSLPENELRESQLKLRPMLQAIARAWAERRSES